MRLLGIKRKSDGEILFLVPYGERYSVASYGLKPSDVEPVKVAVPEEGDGFLPLFEVDENEKEDGVKMERLARHFGMKLADFIKMAAAALGIEHCPTCEMRKKILYKIHEIGWWKALRLIWKTMRKEGLGPEEKDLVDK